MSDKPANASDGSTETPTSAATSTGHGTGQAGHKARPEPNWTTAEIARLTALRTSDASPSDRQRQRATAIHREHAEELILKHFGAFNEAHVSTIKFRAALELAFESVRYAEQSRCERICWAMAEECDDTIIKQCVAEECAHRIAGEVDVPV